MGAGYRQNVYARFQIPNALIPMAGLPNSPNAKSDKGKEGFYTIWTKSHPLTIGLSRGMEFMLKVREILPRLEVWVIYPDRTVLEASQMMAQHGVGALPVINEHGQLIGIVTERDILYQVVARGRDPQTTYVHEIMTRDVEVIDLEDTTVQALYKMQARGCRHLPVLHDNQVIGILSIRDVLWAELRYRQAESPVGTESGDQTHEWICTQCDLRIALWIPPDRCPQCGAQGSFTFLPVI